MMRRQIYDYFFLALLCLILYGILEILSPFAGPLLAAFLFAVTFYPMHRALRHRFPKAPPSFQAAFTDTLVLIFFVTPLVFMGWAIIQESTALISVVKQGSTTVAQWRDGNVLESAPWMTHVRFFLSKVFGMRRDQFQESAIQWANSALDYISLTTTLLAKNAVLLLVDLLIMLFTLFFLFRDGEHLWAWVQNLLPIRHEHKEELSSRIRDSMTGIARGLFLTSLVQGVAATLGYLLVGAEGAVLLGALTAVSGLIPLVGSFAIWAPAGLFYVLKGFNLKGVFIWLWGIVVVVGAVDMFVRPYLVGNKLELPLFALFFALLGGAEIWGAKGLILGPLLFALMPAMLHIYRENYLRRTE